MDKSRIEKLFEIVTPDVKAKLGMLYNATVTCLKEYQATNSAPRLRDWQAAEDALERMVTGLEARYLAKPPALDSLMDAVRFLKEEGYKIGKSKAYQDREAGKIKVQPDGSVLESDALAYAVQAGLKKIGNGRNSDKLEVIAEKRAQEELDLTRARREKIEFETEKDRGLYIKKEEVELRTAIKIAAFESGFKHAIRTSATDWLVALGGDIKKTQLLCDLIYPVIDDLLDQMGKMEEISVVIQRRKGDGHGDDQGNASM